jgi:hypothetical protein
MSERNDCGGKKSKGNYRREEKSKSYTKPKLTNFGKIEELTQGATGKRSDFTPQGKRP